LRERVTARKARLFAVACVRAGVHGLDRPWRVQAVEVGERAADGLASEAELRAAQDAAVGQRGSSSWAVLADDWWSAVEAARFSGDRVEDRRHQCRSARDLFGNPFRPVAVDPGWLTSAVTALACGIYAERAFDRMPILADALMEAG